MFRTSSDRPATQGAGDGRHRWRTQFARRI